MPSSISELDPERRIKFELLKEHYHGVLGFLSALRGIGYIPDHPRSKGLAVAIDELYESIEKKTRSC
jgi:hypothetical protein